MKIENEIAIEDRTTAEGRTAPHLVISLDCLANILMAEIDPDDVAPLLVAICKAAVDAGYADQDAALAAYESDCSENRPLP